jgi:hypothetical protein
LTTTTSPVNLTSDKNKQATPKANKGKTGGIYKPFVAFNGQGFGVQVTR